MNNFVVLSANHFGDHSLMELEDMFGSALLTRVDFKSDTDGKNALYCAIEQSRDDNVEFLIEQGILANRGYFARVFPPLDQLIMLPHDPLLTEKRERIFDLLTGAGFGIAVNSWDKTSLLSRSVCTPFFKKCLKFFRSKNVDWEVYNAALKVAFQYGQLEAIAILRKMGANIFLKPGDIPFHPKYFVEMVDMMQPRVLSWNMMSVSAGTPPDSLVVFYLAGNNVSCECSRCRTSILFCRCLFYARGFVETHKNQLADLQHQNPMSTNERAHLRQWSLYIIRRFVLNQCIVLQEIGLPALVKKEILQALLAKRWPKIIDYHYYIFIEAINQHARSL